MSSFIVECPGCGREMTAEEAALGLRVVCSECRTPFVLAKKQTSLEECFSFGLEESVTELKGARPLCLKIGDAKYETVTWKDLLRIFCEMVLGGDAEDVAKVRYVNYRNTAPGAPRRIYLSSKEKLAPIKIHDDFWLDFQCGGKDVLKIIHWLVKNYGGYIPTVRFYCTNSPLSLEDVRERILALLEKHFSNGIRPNSVIDLNRLKKFYREMSGEEIPEGDISALLSAMGIHVGGKVCIVTPSAREGLEELLCRAVSEGHRLFYYDTFLDVHLSVLQTMNIHSPEQLAAVMKTLPTGMICTKTCFCAEKTDLETEVSRCFESKSCLSYEQLQKSLPYVPLANIKSVLQNGDYVWVREGTYADVHFLEIDESDGHSARAAADREIAAQGFSSLVSMEISMSLELNPDLSESAVRSGLYQKYLASSYDRRGNILTPKGTTMSSMDILRKYCLSHDSVTLEELQEVERELNGYSDKLALFAANEIAVRVNKDLYVRDMVFDVDAIDIAIGLFCTKDVISIRDVTSFASFPNLEGYSWNLYLLESFCRRFSNLFQYQCLAVNSRNVGAIFRKSAGFSDYAEVMASAVFSSGIPLKGKDVGDFLFENGYVARRTNTIDNVIAIVQKMKERKG